MLHYWHERSAVQAVTVRRWTGNDVGGHYFHHSFPGFLRRALFSRIKKKTYLAKVVYSIIAPNNLWLDPFPDPVGHFWAPWWPFWSFEDLI